MDEAQSATIGWYGKLPSLGDFASRRLSPDFIDAWDGWLAGGIAEWRERQPEAWLPAYLAGPSWRFLLMPGVLPGSDPASSFAGVLVPSVDRVGRYFPFTLAWPLARLPHDTDSLGALLRRLHQLDDLAVDALQDDWSVDQLEAELARLDGTPGPVADRSAPLPRAPEPMSAVECAPEGELAACFGAWAVQALGQHWQECALWLSDPGTGQRRLRITQGLPTGTEFALLLGVSADGAAAASEDPGPVNWD